MADIIPKNVNEILNKLSAEVGKYENDIFNQNLWCEINDMNIISPIEQILYCYLRYIAKINDEDNGDVVDFQNKSYCVGLGIFPQHKIGKYRCDFLVNYGTAPKMDGTQRISKELIVECDSQEFHERTEKERRYEKERDRFFISNGYKVFHYTGSDVIKNPSKIAVEIISYLTEIPSDRFQEDSNFGEFGE